LTNFYLMKKLITTFIAIQFVLCGFTQWTNETINIGNKNREYIMYVPNSYNGSQKLAVIFTLHPLGGKSNWVKNFNLDDAFKNKNAIIISPQALKGSVLWYNLGPYWNSGVGKYGVQVNKNVPDTEMMMAILDRCIAKYNVDESKVFATGFSMGGYMSNRLAIQCKGRIKKIASVAGTKGDFIKFNPTTPVSVLHFHGTKDNTVPYKNNDSGNDAEKLVSDWVSHNKCNTTPKKHVYPNKGDNLTFERYDYKGGTNGTMVSFIKVIGGNHKWYRANNNDINYNKVISDFFFSNDVVENDYVSTSKLPQTLSEKSQYQVTVGYAASANRDVVLSLWKGNKKLAENKASVSKGSGNANITLNLSNKLSAGNYTWRVELRPRNGGANSALDVKEKAVTVGSMITPIGKTISILATSNNKYIAAEKEISNAPLEADRNNVDAWEKFDVVDAGDGNIALLANANGNYVCADKSINSGTPPVVANRSQVSKWEKFKWITIDENSFVLQSNTNGKYIRLNTSMKDKPLVAAANSINDAEVFQYQITTKTAVNIMENAFTNTLEVFPIPATDVLNFNISLEEELAVHVELFNFMGQKVYTEYFGFMEQGSHTTTLNIKNYDSGMYILTYSIGKESATKKIMIR
ncbi:MAG: T9SS type A sorting domain-containing protein, partial [Bacteroidales bacterium]|nr:T9SS type A sorting domain-containing protein [Bacteroidales bacterium]